MPSRYDEYKIMRSHFNLIEFSHHCYDEFKAFTDGDCSIFHSLVNKMYHYFRRSYYSMYISLNINFSVNLLNYLYGWFCCSWINGTWEYYFIDIPLPEVFNWCDIKCEYAYCSVFIVIIIFIIAVPCSNSWLNPYFYR